MSGIFGFSYRQTACVDLNDAIGGLSYWNRIYGREASDARLIGNSGLGCHIEHFSDRFPYASPILDHHGCPAVIDALIYNRDELLTCLGLDTDFPISDEALLLMLIDTKGHNVLSMVNGDFAGAIYDPVAQKWTLFRDHLGVRPLYTYLDNNIFAFSTDMRALLSLPGADRSINEVRLYEDITGQNYLSLQDTEFARIKCAMPAAVTYVSISDTSYQIRESVYWRIRRKKIRLRSDEAYREKMYTLVEDAVNRRCDAISGPLGAELSGGLDSSVIDILISRHGRKPFCYSWSMDPAFLPLKEELDERKVVMSICKQEGLECRFRTPEDARQFRYRCGEYIPPNIDTIHISYGSAWLHEKGAKVVFTGHGGDEGVSHRGQRFELFYQGEIFTYYKYYWQDSEGESLRLLRALKRGTRDAWARIKDIYFRPVRNDRYSVVLNPLFRDRISREYVRKNFYFSYAPHKYIMQGGTRPRMDNAAYQGAFNGVRYLFPYVDYRVIDYAVSIPRRLHITHSENRAIFRESFRKIMPESLYLVNYKYSPSTRGQSYTQGYEQRFRDRVEATVNSLDREVWGQYLDFDQILKLAPAASRHSNDAGILSALLANIGRYAAMEKLQKQAMNWREFDERDKETV